MNKSAKDNFGGGAQTDRQHIDRVSSSINEYEDRNKSVGGRSVSDEKRGIITQLKNLTGAKPSKY